MSRSRRPSCGNARCGICAPHKNVKHRISRLAKLPARDRRKLGKRKNKGLNE